MIRWLLKNLVLLSGVILDGLMILLNNFLCVLVLVCRDCVLVVVLGLESGRCGSGIECSHRALVLSVCAIDFLASHRPVRILSGSVAVLA